MVAAWVARGVVVTLTSAIPAVAAVPVAAKEPAPPPAAKVWNPPSIYPDLAAAPAGDVADADWLWRRSKRVAKRRFQEAGELSRRPRARPEVPRSARLLV